MPKTQNPADVLYGGECGGRFPGKGIFFRGPAAGLHVQYYHLYLLDILMPDRNGIDLGRIIIILLHWLFIFPPRRTLPWMPFMSSPSRYREARHKANLFLSSQKLSHLKVDTDTSSFLFKTKPES
ncbi:MAG: hypothetical protein ACLVAW_05375 [Eisenbergiella massiliensis]